jgi:hypothetical protein
MPTFQPEAVKLKLCLQFIYTFSQNHFVISKGVANGSGHPALARPSFIIVTVALRVGWNLRILISSAVRALHHD